MIIKNKEKNMNVNFLICTVAHNHNYSILTTDQDFDNFKQYISIVLL